MVFARALRRLFVCLTVASALGCGNSSGYAPVIINVQAIAPPAAGSLFNTIPAGTTTILITGLFFDSSSVVYVNGKPQKTTFVGDVSIGVPDARAVDVDLDPAIAGVPGQVSLTAQGADTPMSTPFALGILEAQFQVTSVTPRQVPAGSGDTTITYVGTGFNPSAEVSLDDTTFIPATFVSTTLVTAVIPAAFLRTAAVHRLIFAEQQNCPFACQNIDEFETFTVGP
jgi:hypothetical protein